MWGWRTSGDPYVSACRCVVVLLYEKKLFDLQEMCRIGCTGATYQMLSSVTKRPYKSIDFCST